MNIRPFVPSLFASALLVACSATDGKSPAMAEAPLAPTQGNTASGNVRFAETEGGVTVEARVTGLTPGGHGFHLHEKGDCSAPDGTSAGAHFNPTGAPHGHPDKPGHHLGDLPMLMADSNGQATLTATVKGLSIGGDANTNIVGRAVIVHAAADDYATQPTGNSGARLACGVIGAK
jgi:Cu-Zn family superoxide dismutase